jgi:hypothetical protein
MCVLYVLYSTVLYFPPNVPNLRPPLVCGKFPCSWQATLPTLSHLSTPQPSKLQLDCPLTSDRSLPTGGVLLPARGIQRTARAGWLSMRSPVKHSCTLLPRLPRARMRRKLSFIAALSLTLFNGARQPQTGIPSQSKLVLLALWSVPARKPAPVALHLCKRVDTARWRFGTWAQGTLHTAHYTQYCISVSLVLSFPSAPRPFHPKAGQQRRSWSKPQSLLSILPFSLEYLQASKLQPPQNRGKHEISCQEQS